ncbi:MAG: hypothetical protein SF053_19155 [Bacteroidia bacterium]|nr:hypothetical protein [Bacteroidia bacterium]
MGIMISGCQGPGTGGESAVATYGQTTLLRQDLARMIPDSLSAADSTLRASQIVEAWLQDQAIAEEARKVIPEADARIKPQLLAYENHLLEQAYLDWMMDQQNSTLQVPLEEVQAYYEKNRDKYVSTEPYYQFFYLKTEQPNQYKLVNLIRSDDPGQIQELISWAQDNATEFRLDSTWAQDWELERVSNGFYFGNIRNASLATPYPYQHNEGDKTYYDFFRMIRKIKPGDPLPFSLCRTEIENLLKSQQVQKIMEETRSRLVQQARAANKITTN